MSERLDRIENLLVQLVETQQRTQQQIDSTNRAVEAFGTYTNAMGERLEASMENFTQTVNEAIAAQDERQRTTDQQIQALIDESRENARQHAEFRDTNDLQAAQEELTVMVTQVTGATALNNQQIEVLIAESQENTRQHAEFRERIEALTESLQTLLGQVMSRVNDIWERMAS
ncbi:MAG: hypothetical protein AAGC93_16420 [Cyanobacteria bacterium P01_F01_bin.53]